MAQYLDKTLDSLDDGTSTFPAWKAHNLRQICRELAGIRGCAPAVQMHDTSYDSISNTDVNTPDDRIFHVHAYTPIHVWGQEMHIGGETVRDNGHDALNIYYRPFGGEEGDWLLVKGCREYGMNGKEGISVAGAGSPVFSPTEKLTAIDDRVPYYINSGHKHYASSCLSPVPQPTRTNFYPPATCDSLDCLDGCTPSNRSAKYNHFPYVSEEFVCGNHLINGSYGPGTTSNDSTSINNSIYAVYASSHVRCFLFHREGEYKLEIDETLSHKGKSGVLNDLNRENKWYTKTDANLPTVANCASGQINATSSGSPKEAYRKRKNEKYKPVDYASNPGLYLSLPEQLSGFGGGGKNPQTYTSRFTRSILLKVFMPDKDLVTGQQFTRVSIDIPPGTVRTNNVVTQPYTAVAGYGAFHEGNSSNTFIAKPAGPPETKYETTVNERFTKMHQRWNPSQTTSAGNDTVVSGGGMRVLNRRHLLIEGITIKANPDNRDSTGHSFRPYIDSSDYAGEIIDFRGSVFRDCVFEDTNIDGAQRNVMFGGCKFINCKFIRTNVSVIGDSNMFIHCTFEGRAKETYDSLYFGGNSNAMISCHFENLVRLFFMGTQDYPATDNLWLRNTFDCILFNSAGSETFVVENYSLSQSSFSSNCPSGGCPVRAFPVGGSNRDKIKNREFSRNMMLCNRFYDNSILQISTYNGFSRANFYFQNGSNGPVEITTKANTIDTGSSYYDVHTQNNYNSFRLKLQSHTHHMRLVDNIFTEIHLHNRSSSSLQQGSDDYRTGTFQISTTQGFPEPEIPALGQTWACPLALHSTGNKIINNWIVNWAGFIDNFVGSSCSPFHNFYVIEGCLNCHLGRNASENSTSKRNIGGFNEDLYNEMLDWVDNFQGGDGKLINVAYKNKFIVPTSHTSDNLVGGTTYGFPWTIDTDCECNQATNIASSYNCNCIFIGEGTDYPDINGYSNTSYTRVSPDPGKTKYDSGLLFDHISKDILTSSSRPDTYLVSPSTADYPNSNIVSTAITNPDAQQSGTFRPPGYLGFAPVINTTN